MVYRPSSMVNPAYYIGYLPAPNGIWSPEMSNVELSTSNVQVSLASGIYHWILEIEHWILDIFPHGLSSSLQIAF